MDRWKSCWKKDKYKKKLKKNDEIGLEDKNNDIYDDNFKKYIDYLNHLIYIKYIIYLFIWD